MSNLSAFLAENALPVEHIKFPVSPRVRDKDKKPIEWEIKTITGKLSARVAPSGFLSPAKGTSSQGNWTQMPMWASWPWPVPFSPT